MSCLKNNLCFALFFGYQEEETSSWKKMITVSVSGAAGMIANHLLFKVRSTKNIRKNQNTFTIFIIFI